jgi:hypothetical protein
MRSDKDSKKVYAILVTFRFQKNRQNGQQIRLVINKDHPKLCLVKNMVIMVLRKRKLGHCMDLPVEIYVNKKGEVKYLTSNKSTEIIRKKQSENSTQTCKMKS